MIDLKLDDLNHDLTVQNYDLQLVTEADQLTQKLKNKILFFYSEWFLDTTQGVQYYEIALVKNPDLVLISNMIKAAILDTQGVFEIISYEQTMDNRARKLSVNFIVDTIYGNLTVTA